MPMLFKHNGFAFPEHVNGQLFLPSEREHV